VSKTSREFFIAGLPKDLPIRDGPLPQEQLETVLSSKPT